MVLSVGYAYERFMVMRDYTVAYEGTCDPAIQSCFVGCEDDECVDEYYYTKVQKYAVDLYAQCGPDITDCDVASACLPEDGKKCTVTFCDPVVDGGECSAVVQDSVSAEEINL